MPTPNVLFQLVCSADDPQVPSRVLGIFAARSVLPERYVSELVAGSVRIDVGIHVTGTETFDCRHLARVLCRIATVETMRLTINGRRVAFELEGGS